jgi:hypothetical protein
MQCRRHRDDGRSVGSSVQYDRDSRDSYETRVPPCVVGVVLCCCSLLLQILGMVVEGGGGGVGGGDGNPDDLKGPGPQVHALRVSRDE